MSMSINKILLLIAVLLCHLNTASASVQSLESLHAAALTFLQNETKDIQNSEISVRPLDRRLRLNQCSSSLEAFWPLENRKFGSTTVGIRCNGDKPWKIFIGTHIHIYKYVWVSNHALSRDQQITIEDISQERRDITKLSNGYLHANTQLIGKQMKRNIPANQVLTNIMLQSKKLVKRGDRITIISRSGRIEVQAIGVALSDGSKGDRIRVRNMSSKREIEAYVSDKHRVLLTL